MLSDLIIHDKCNMPVEFCECEHATVKYDWDEDIFILYGILKVDRNNIAQYLDREELIMPCKKGKGSKKGSKKKGY